jgi:predicted nucleic acid-binding protein
VNAYLDSSVLLRIVLREPDRLAEWDQLTAGITSTLTQLEAARTLDREAVLQTATEAELEAKEDEIADILRRVDAIAIDERVLQEASRPLPVVLGTLDAIHLASPVLYRASQPHDERPIYFATHDKQLAAAARAMHFDVIGVPA